MNHRTERILKIGPLAILFVFIVIYAFFGSRALIFGIKIKNVSIIDGSTYTESPIEVTGVAKGAINLEINGREISIDQEGNFKDTIALLPGYNIINLKALDKFGYVDEKNYKLIRQ